MKMTDFCPVCKGRHIYVFIKRQNVPVHQNFLLPSYEEARSVETGQLTMAVCEECGFVFNMTFDPLKLKYGEKYDNTQSCSGFFDKYLDGLVEKLIEKNGIKNSVIVEIGCGKGQFLRKLISYPCSGNTGYGFDPSYIGETSDINVKLTFKKCYFDDTCIDLKADAVVCRHVIEHISDPVDFLKSIRRAIRNFPYARLFFETPCLEWILRNRVVWDFFYEHCSLFTASSLRKAFELSGFNVRKIEHVFEGQYLWLEADSFSDGDKLSAYSYDETVQLALNYQREENDLFNNWLSKIKRFADKGKTAIWGAGAKGVTFVNLFDNDRSLIDCVVDINPNKQGGFIPGSGHPIVGISGLLERDVKSVILMNPNYREENRKLLAEAGIFIELAELE